jgi:eukaryotic-like serine/threonine-protein kinase
MTPERWRRIDDLFDAAVRLGPVEREVWLHGASGSEADLRREVGSLLAHDNRAEAEGFLTPPLATERSSDRTGSRHSHGKHRPSARRDALNQVEAGSAAGGEGFAPKAAIAPGPQPHPISESESVVRARLREVPMIYILFMGMVTFYRIVVLGYYDLVIYYLDLTITLSFAAAIVLLSSRWPISLSRLKALELGMLGLFASRDAIVEYRLVLEFSQRGDPVMAQLTVKNLVLLTCILILTYGLYVPKTWRRAALVAGTLALFPFAPLLGLYALYPAAMHWLAEGMTHCESSRVFLFTFDAMTLIIVAIASAFGARAISRLRRQVALARQLGQYRLRQRIGGGGMGEVFLAEHQLLKRPCALKLIRPGAAVEPKALARFEREVQLTATLSHPNTVEIFDYGRTEDGSYYYVMEYLPGLSLSELVEQYGPLPPGRAVYLLRQVCLALREAHAAGLIHRDIKPSNIFAARRGGMDDVAKLLDFGLVRAAATVGAPHLSDEGQILGTPLFMSPEQALGRHELDERSDIYSLGAVAYYLLTGRPPFDDEGAIGVMIAHARDSVVSLSQVNPAIPDDLERVVMRCLAKEPVERFVDAASLEQALGECGCAAEWDHNRAAWWWQDARQILT